MLPLSVASSQGRGAGNVFNARFDPRFFRRSALRHTVCFVVRKALRNKRATLVYKSFARVARICPVHQRRNSHIMQQVFRADIHEPLRERKRELAEC